jgi:hypothetical protein
LWKWEDNKEGEAIWEAEVLRIAVDILVKIL